MSDQADGKCRRCKGNVPPRGSQGNLFYCSEPCRIEKWNSNNSKRNEHPVKIFASNF